jgi:hypothetical protein
MTSIRQLPADILSGQPMAFAKSRLDKGTDALARRQADRSRPPYRQHITGIQGRKADRKTIPYAPKVGAEPDLQEC